MPQLRTRRLTLRVVVASFARTAIPDGAFSVHVHDATSHRRVGVGTKIVISIRLVAGSRKQAGAFHSASHADRCRAHMADRQLAWCCRPRRREFRGYNMPPTKLLLGTGTRLAPSTVITTINRQNVMALISRYPCTLNLYEGAEVQARVPNDQLAQYRGGVGGAVECAGLINSPTPGPMKTLHPISCGRKVAVERQKWQK